MFRMNTARTRHFDPEDARYHFCRSCFKIHVSVSVNAFISSYGQYKYFLCIVGKSEQIKMQTARHVNVEAAKEIMTISDAGPCDCVDLHHA